MRSSLWLSLVLVWLPVGSQAAVDGWTRLKIGMTTDEAVTALGAPLQRNIGRGFELWTYDHQAEVLFYGDVIGWTTPGEGGGARRSTDVWQLNQGRDDFLAVLRRLPPSRSLPAKPRPAAPAPANLNWRPTLRFRV